MKTTSFVRSGLMRVTLAGALALVAVPVLAVDWFKLPILGAGEDGAKGVSGTAVGTGGNTDAGSARVRVLNKNTNRIVDLTIGENKTVEGGAVRVSLRRCVRDMQGVPGQDVAWLDVSEIEGGSLYSGWMFNLYPDVAALENPRYDVRLLGCVRTGVPTVAKTGKKAPADLGGYSTPTEDAEAPADGGDPNYVPGIGGPNSGAPMTTPVAPAEIPPSPPPAEQVEPEAGPGAVIQEVQPVVEAAPPAEVPAAVEQPVAPVSAEQDELHQMMDGTQ